MESGIGERIRSVMEYRGITQKELADRAGITEAAVSRYVNGGRTPRAVTIAAIAKALNVPAAEIIGDDPCASGELDNAVRLIARNARSMSDAQREEIIRALAQR